ncbi:MAG: hypothetical protein RL006_1088 [Chloroflexota bacterium]|jgi:hypothetical protein
MIVAIGLAIVWGSVLVFITGVEVGLRLSEVGCGQYCPRAFKEAKP